jgi:adenylate cyclase
VSASQLERRLATILVVDVAGYTRHAERAEEAVVQRLKLLHANIGSRVAEAGGRVFSRAGDAALAEFGSPVKGLRCAVEVQRDMTLANRDLPPPDRIELRLGLHLADVVVSGDDLLGDGVNIAARVQQAAEPGSIMITQALLDQVKRNCPFRFDDLGPHLLKHISEPVPLFRVADEMGPHRFYVEHAAAEPAPAPRRRPTVAVLPFLAVPRPDEDQYLADGFTEDLIGALSRFRRVIVISMSASFAYAGRPVEPRQAGRELGARFVVVGRLRRAKDALRITAELVATETGEQVWADRFDGALPELFDVQDRLVQRIVATAIGRIEAHDIAAARRKPPQEMRAYEYLLRGLEFHRLGGITAENVHQAVAWFDRAIAADPTYARAYAWRVCASSWLPDFDAQDGIRYVERALELDENDAEAHRVMGSVLLMVRDYERSGLHHRRAVELNPSDAYILARSAAFHTYNGEPERALELVDEAVRLDPFLPGIGLAERGYALFALERYAEAAEVLGALPYLDLRSSAHLTAARRATGDEAGAKAALENTLRIAPGFTVTDFIAAERYRRTEDTERLRRWLLAAGAAASSAVGR